MSTRHEARQWAIQLLFQRDFNRDELADALAEFWRERKASARARVFTELLVQGVEQRREELDGLLQRYAENWNVRRMGAVDRNVLRAALYEMLYCPDIPPVVTINEAVEIAKEFSGVESGKFVNGILDRARQELPRPARTAAGGEGREEESNLKREP